MSTASDTLPRPAFPTAADVRLGLGIGDFFDGLVLHRILHWHLMTTSAGLSADTVAGLRANTLMDGLFHVAALAFKLAGLALLWRAARRPHPRCRAMRFRASC